jgi:hypothetical protein
MKPDNLLNDQFSKVPNPAVFRKDEDESHCVSAAGTHFSFNQEAVLLKS